MTGDVTLGEIDRRLDEVVEELRRLAGERVRVDMCGVLRSARSAELEQLRQEVAELRAVRQQQAAGRTAVVVAVIAAGASLASAVVTVAAQMIGGG